MKITIDISKEFECNYQKNKFAEFFNKVIVDIKRGDVHMLCENYEVKTAKMLINAFEESEVME